MIIKVFLTCYSHCGSVVESLKEMLNAWKQAFYKELFTYENMNMNKMKIQMPTGQRQCGGEERLLPFGYENSHRQ